MKTRIVGPSTAPLLIAAICLVPAASAADPIPVSTVIYSTFGPGDTFNRTGFAIGGLPFPQSEAPGFIPGDTFTLDRLRIAASSPGGVQGIRFSIASTLAGAPGTPLETFSIIPTPTASIATINSVLHPTLDGGTMYWLIAEPTNPAIPSVAVWNFELSSEGPLATRDGTLPWRVVSNATQPVFEIIGTTATPEPATLALFAFGAMGMLARRRRLSR